MNTNELRRGNLIFEDVLGICTVESVFNNKLEVSVPNGKTDGTINKRWFIMDSYNFRPIPLAEDWLLKFGFKLFGKNTYYLGTVKIHKRKRGFVIAKRYADILHVHQLQNLYFALTQKELTIK